MATVAILNKEGKEKSKFDLPENVFKDRVKQDVIHQAVIMYQACQRQGTASTKERADVSGGGRKPHRQKGTGQARAGSRRSPLWIGGGVTFGPHPREFRYSVPKKIRRAALRESLNAKFHSEDLVFIDELKDEFKKTKEFAAVLSKLKLSGKILALLDGSNESIRLASRNIPRFSLKKADDVNALDIMSTKKLILTKTAFEALLKRIEGEAKS